MRSNREIRTEMFQTPSHRSDRHAALRVQYAFGVLIAALSLTSVGCVNRRATITSNPSGALVLLDGERIGYTPVSFEFQHYGTREITLIKPGYATLTTLQKIAPPWYQIPPLDFVSDNFLPGKVIDRQRFNYMLTQDQPYPTDEILGRANHLRSESQLSP